MYTVLDPDTWSRKDHFHFFRKFEEPFFGVTVEVDCAKAYRHCKESGASFFLYYLYRSLRAANEIEPFRYRIQGEEVRVYDQVHASPTINRPDGSFGFAYMDYQPEEEVFRAGAEAEIQRVQASTGLLPALSGENVIHYSSLPWLRFTQVSHARAFSFPDSCPKITFGKMEERMGRTTMPVSIHVHHALMDGYHVGLFVQRFQDLLHS